MDRHLWLIGMMGSGKTTAARAIAGRWGEAWIDTDEEVGRIAGCSIAQLWGDLGEAAFRRRETAALARIAAGYPTVVATGGGAVLDTANIAVMRESGVVVWLSASAAVLSERVGTGADRPLLSEDSSLERLREILESRHESYVSAADWVVEVEGLAPEHVVERIEAAWNKS